MGLQMVCIGLEGLDKAWTGPGKSLESTWERVGISPWKDLERAWEGPGRAWEGPGKGLEGAGPGATCACILRNTEGPPQSCPVSYFLETRGTPSRNERFLVGVRGV